MNRNQILHYTALSIAGTFLATMAMAQRGEIENQTYEIVKEKSIEFPPANRLFDKVQPIQAKATDKKVGYAFIDPKISLSSPKLTPVAIAPSDEKTRSELPEAMNNFIKLGAGNYGRFQGEGFLSSRLTNDLVFTGQVKQLSATTGPVYGTNSANSSTQVKLGGKYLRETYKVDGAVEYDRNNTFFYGYKPQPEGVVVNRDSLRQTINTLGVQIGFENTEPKSLIDYAVNTSFYSLRDRYAASEIDWGTTLSASVPLDDHFYALLEGGAFVSQRVDAETFNRNLFRVKPTFKYVTDQFSVTAGVNAVNETDNTLNINRTRAYPVLNIDVVPLPGFHVFAGWNGDIVRNTLRSMLSENIWLGPNVLVANTEKQSDIYGGIKGENSDGLNFEGKVSYARYKNFYVFNNSLTDTSRFSILYDGLYTNVLTVSAQVGYTLNDLFKTSLKGNFYNYEVNRLEEAWHRPSFTLNWFNAITISKKLFVTSDLYTVSGLKAKNFQSGIVTKLPAIVDLNLKIDYLLTKNFSTYVSINNILGKQYSRYQYYPQQGMNFVGGLSFSF